MSHTTTQKAVCTNEIVLQQTCERLQAQYLGRGQHSLYSSKHQGLGVKLKGWNFPVIFTDQGECMFDNYNGAWGDIEDLNRFKQYYPVEAAKHAYAGQGTVVEEVLANGDVKCVITLGGGTQLVGDSPAPLGPGGISLS
jgi:hypothetical protein